MKVSKNERIVFLFFISITLLDKIITFISLKFLGFREFNIVYDYFIGLWGVGVASIFAFIISVVSMSILLYVNNRTKFKMNYVIYSLIFVYIMGTMINIISIILYLLSIHL